MRQLTLFLLGLTLMLGCETQPDSSALHARITLQPTQKATCVVLQVESTSGQRLAETRLERAEGKDAFSVAIFRGAFPEEIRLAAHPRYGTGCADPLFPNGEGSTQTARFPPQDSVDVALALSGPLPANDVDGDGFASEASGGPDCADTDPSAYPGAAESCAGGVDLNCNGKIGCQDPVCANQVCADPPAQIAFASVAQRLSAGACSAAVTVQARDTFGSPRAVTAATQVSLSAPQEAGVTFYANASCGTPISDVMIPVGSAEGTFYFRATTVGSATLTATVVGVTPATQTQTIDPGVASALVFRSAAQALPAGQCSGRVTLRTEDALGNASALTSTTSVGLSAAPAAGFAFYSDAGCTTGISSVSIAAGSSEASFYFKGTLVGTVTVTANGGVGFGSVLQSEAIQPGPAAALEFTSAAKLETVNACSTRVDFRTEDAFANPTPVATETSVALSSPGPVTFYSDAGCTTAITAVTIAAGEGAGAFYFRAASTGQVDLTLSSNGFVSKTQTETIVAAGPTTLAFVGAPTTQEAGQCSAAITVQSRDSFGNPSNVSENTPVSLGATPSTGVTFYSDSGCSTEITTVQIDNASNTSAAFHFRATQAGTVSLGGTSGSFNPASHDVAVGAAPPSAIEITTGTHEVTAGQCSPAVTVRSRDQFGNTSPVTGGAVLGLSATPPDEFTFHTSADCSSAAVTQATIFSGQSTTTFYFSGKRSGSVSITVDASSASLGTQTQAHTLTPAAPAGLTITSAGQTRAAGQCSGAVSVRAEDTYGNASPISGGATVSLSASPATGFTFYSDSGCTSTITDVGIAPDASSAQDFYWKGTTAGSVDLTAASGSLTSAVQGQTITAGPQARLVITTAARTVTAGQCSGAVTVEVRDEYDNPASSGSSLTVALADNVPTADAFTFHATDTCGDGAIDTVAIDAGSTTQTFYFKGTQAGSAEVTVSSGGLTPSTQQQTINPGAPDRITFTTGPHSVPVSECSPANTLQIRDVYDNASPVSASTIVALAHDGTGVTFHTASDCSGAGVTELTVPSGQSEVSFYFVATTVQSVTLTATVSGLPNPSAMQTETITAGPPAQLQITAGPTSHDADATCSAILTAQIQDADGNPTNATADTAVNLTSTASSNFTFYSDGGCTSPVSSVQITSGTSSQDFYFRARTAESVTITAANATLGQDTHGVTVTPGVAKVLRITSAPQSGVVAGTCSAVVSLQTRDEWNNVANVGANTTVNLSDSQDPNTTFKFYSDAGCVTEISSTEVSSGTSSASFYFRGEQAGTVTVQVNATSFTGDSQAEGIVHATADRLNFDTEAQMISPNTCSAITSVEATDPYGNRVSTNHTITLTATPEAGMTFYTDSACAETATTTVTTAEGLASFYWKATNKGAATITAESAPLTLAQQTQTVGKLVKSGTCTIADGDTDGVQSCAIPAADVISDLTRAILFWQATGPIAGAAESAVMCYFESTSSIACERTSTSAGNGAIEIAWHVVEFPASSGIYVEHRSPANLSVTCPASATSFDISLSQAVNASRSFVLLSSRRGGNAAVTSIYKRAFLASDGTKVTITTSPCAGGGEPMALQIVDFPGAVVERGSLSLSGATASATLPQADLTRSFLLYTMDLPDAANSAICQRAIRGYMSSDTSVDFSRANNALGCTLANSIQVTYERVLLPSGNKVQAFNQTIAALSDTATLTLPTAVDLSRAVAFTGGQAVSGQSMGETGSIGDNPNTARARLSFTDSTSLVFQRPNVAGTTTDEAQFTGYVVEFVSP